jgi:hypothetical protein
MSRQFAVNVISLVSSKSCPLCRIAWMVLGISPTTCSFGITSDFILLSETAYDLTVSPIKVKFLPPPSTPKVKRAQFMPSNALAIEFL